MMKLLLLLLTLALESFSPGGTYRLQVSSEEMKMSHWIDRPYVTRVSDQRVIYRAEYPWSLNSHRWLSEDILELDLRRYPGDCPSCSVRLRLRDARFQQGGDKWRPLAELDRVLEQFYEANRRH